jgi:hypothetical protein
MGARDCLAKFGTWLLLLAEETTHERLHNHEGREVLANHLLDLLHVKELNRGERLSQCIEDLDEPLPDVIWSLLQPFTCPTSQDDAVQLWFRNLLPNFAPVFRFAVGELFPSVCNRPPASLGGGDFGDEHLFDLFYIPTKAPDLPVELGKLGSHLERVTVPPGIKPLTDGDLASGALVLDKSESTMMTEGVLGVLARVTSSNRSPPEPSSGRPRVWAGNIGMCSGRVPSGPDLERSV